MSHVKLNLLIQLSPAQEKVTNAKIAKFSDAVTIILRNEAASKLKKLAYVFIRVDQRGLASFTYEIDDSRDRISEATRRLIKASFEEVFATPATG